MTLAAPASAVGRAGTPTSSNSPFPGWEVFILQFVHPVKVAVVEALLWFGEPLSASQLALCFISEGEGFRESNVRYHVSHLVTVGVLEFVPPASLSEGSGKRKFVYFAGCAPHGSDYETLQ